MQFTESNREVSCRLIHCSEQRILKKRDANNHSRIWWCWRPLSASWIWFCFIHWTSPLEGFQRRSRNLRLDELISAAFYDTIRHWCHFHRSWSVSSIQWMKKWIFAISTSVLCVFLAHRNFSTCPIYKKLSEKSLLVQWVVWTCRTRLWIAIDVEPRGQNTQETQELTIVCLSIICKCWSVLQEKRPT